MSDQDFGRFDAFSALADEAALDEDAGAREERRPDASGVRAGAAAPRIDELAEVVVRKLDRYFDQLAGRAQHPLYELVVHAVERPLLEYVMARCRDNQREAAALLGINRNTLRKKLADHGLLTARATKRGSKKNA